VVKPPEPKRLQQLLRDLDAEEFAVRQQAERELENLGERAITALQQFLKSKTSAEGLRRVRRLLAAGETAAAPTTPEGLRVVRAVTVLEHLGTPEARKVLQVWSAGAEGALLTREAKASLARLQQFVRPR
jgi:HEAT repeat protein